MPFYTKRMVRFLEGKDGSKKKKDKQEKGLRIAPSTVGKGAKSNTTSAVPQTEVQTTAPAEVVADKTFDEKKLKYMKGLLKASVERIGKEKGALSDKHRYFSRYSIMAEEAPIGESAICKVFKAQHQEFKDSVLAVKTYEGEHNIDPNGLHMRVLRVLGKKHPNIIQTWDIFHNSESNTIWIFQELANRGPLDRHLESNPCNEAQAGKWIWQLLRALDYLGDIGVCHRSLQPKHILLTHKELKVKLSGFENAVIYWDSHKEDIKNIPCIPLEERPTDVPSYQAPEVYGDPTKEEFDPVVADVWSLGATMHFMFAKQYPYDIASADNIGAAIQSNVDKIHGLSADGKKLLSEMLKPIATERKHIDKLAVDPWLKAHKE